MSNYGWVGKHVDELLQAVGMINHAAALLSSDDRIAQRDAVKLLHRTECPIVTIAGHPLPTSTISMKMYLIIQRKT